MVLFPEGGFLRKRRAVSQKYAEKNNLPMLRNVTLPRVGALKTILTTVGPQEIPNNNSPTSLSKNIRFIRKFVRIHRLIFEIS